MSVTNFIPALWEAMLLEQWLADNVFANLVNRDYEGTLTKGNTVHITGVVTPTIHDYKAAGRVTTPDAISTTQVDLVIDQEKVFDFKIDDIDEVQAAGSLAPFTTAAAEALIADSDKFIANMLVSKGSYMPYTGALTTADNVFDTFADAQKLLNKNAIPVQGRVAVINAETYRLLVGSASKLMAFDTSGDTNGLRNGTVGGLLGFRVVLSLHLPDNSTPQAVFYHPRAAAYVSQIDKVEARRDQNSFSDRIMGLHVYGGKVVRPEGVFVWNEGGS